MAAESVSNEASLEAVVASPGTALSRQSEQGIFHAVTHHRSFRFLWSAGVITQLGQWFQSVAIGWLALVLTDSPSFVGQIGFASGIPILLLSFPAGALLDRIDRRLALLACQLAGAALALGVAFVNWRGWIVPWHLILASVLSGILMAIVQPATQTLVPALVPREDLPNALALSSAGNSSTRIIGPSIAGALIGAVGIAGCYLSQAGTLLIAAALTMVVRLPAGARAGATLGGGLLDGLRIIRRDRVLTGLLLFSAIPALFAFPYVQMLPVFARNVLHLGPRGLGLIMATSGVGSLTGALMIAKLGNVAYKGRLMVIGGIIYGVVLTAFAQSRWLPVSVLVIPFSAFIGSAFYSLNQILVQTHTSEALRGRVMGALAMSFGLMPVGALFVGALAQQIGAPWAVTGGSLCSSLGLVLITLRYQELIHL